MHAGAYRVYASLLTGCGVLLLTACANHHFSLLGGNAAPLHVNDTFKAAAVQPIDTRKPITVLVLEYEDGRSNAPSRRIGEIRDTFVSDMNGDKVEIDQNVAALVTSAMRAQLKAAGYQVIDHNGVGARSTSFVLSGRINEFSLDVLSRDKVEMEVQARLKGPGADEVVWSGTVREDSDRFAGVSGNSRASLVSYLNKSLQQVTFKTVNSVTATLVQARPDLFLQAGMPSPGVTVQTAPHAVVNEESNVVPQSTNTAETGMLSIVTVPAAVKVYIGDVYYGLSPLSLKLASGIYSVRLSADGYRDVDQKISVRAGETTDWHSELER